MNSKKAIWSTRVGQKTYRKFRLPKEYKKSNFPPSERQEAQHALNKRARKLDWILVLGFKEDI